MHSEETWWKENKQDGEWYDIGYIADTIIIASRSLAKSFYYDDAWLCVCSREALIETKSIDWSVERRSMELWKPISITVVIDNPVDVWWLDLA